MTTKPTKADIRFLKLLKEVKTGLHRRMGTRMCLELHWDCSDCKTRILISLLNSWIDLLEWQVDPKSITKKIINKEKL